MEELIDSILGKIRVIKLGKELRDLIQHLKWGRHADTKVDAAHGGGRKGHGSFTDDLPYLKRVSHQIKSA